MDCMLFSRFLERLLEDRLTEEERRRMLEHAERCQDCRVMLEPPADLAGSVLERTSGSTCGSARELLCGHVDDDLEEIDAELAAVHLRSCPDCSALAGALSRLAADLPLLAEMETDEKFTAEVLARTARRGLAERVERIVSLLLQRPRIAWEGAYIGTFMFALIFITPGSPLADTPRKALQIAAVNPVAELAEPIDRMQDRVAAGASYLRDMAGDRALHAWRYALHVVEYLEEELGTIVDGFASEQESEETSEKQGEAQ
jgi:predicted anti-sigma-YlaC factor YlaD